MGADDQPTEGLFNRDRAYDGQPHTDQGERGRFILVPDVGMIKNPNKVVPHTITLRDIHDAVIIGILHAKKREHPKTGETIPVDEIDSNEMLWHQLDMDPDFDPIAAAQNASVEIEKRLGIYPNVSALEPGYEHGDVSEAVQIEESPS